MPRARTTSGRATPVVLTIAGSDSGGGAGIQADLKAFAACGVHGACAITSATAQNTVGVSAIHPIPPEVVLAQVRAVASDLGIDAVKVGMLGSADVARAVAAALVELGDEVPVVVDPVMVAESGAPLLEPAARSALAEAVLPRAHVATPNLHEARALAGVDALRDRADARGEDAEVLALAHAVLAMGPRAVVVTGGHRERAVDLYVDGAGDSEGIEIAGARHADGATHGSGCTHASILAAQLALGASPLQAARTARAIAAEAVSRGLRDLGTGAGPVDVIGLERLRGAR
jgi:hydroxymethylpyrimidine/phosphomethylpyrimidine kinase